VKLDIAATDLAIAQKDTFWTDKLDVYLVQREVSGTKAHITGQTLGLRLKPATYQQYLHDGIPFSQAIEAWPALVGAHCGAGREFGTDGFGDDSRIGDRKNGVRLTGRFQFKANGPNWKLEFTVEYASWSG